MTDASPGQSRLPQGTGVTQGSEPRHPADVLKAAADAARYARRPAVTGNLRQQMIRHPDHNLREDRNGFPQETIRKEGRSDTIPKERYKLAT